MALQTATPPTAHSSQFVGNAFVDQYYKILHNPPELVYRFYQDSSVISRPDSNGVMTSATVSFLGQMALQTATPPTAHSAQFVGNAFVDQYYKILHNSPELFYRFYQDSSVISRPDSNGVMTSATTMQGINEKILSFDYKDYMVDIKTADAQKSYKEGVFVLVTGCLTGKDNLKRIFAQSFFLASQDNGYYVLNDVFRYVEDVEQLESGAVNGVDAATEPSLISEPNLATAQEDADQIVVGKAYDASEYERELVNEKKPAAEIPSHSHANDITVDVESSPAAALEDAPKKSYASIVNVPKGSLGPTQVYVPTNFLNVSSKKVENQQHLHQCLKHQHQVAPAPRQ
ncbi:hypothetical protein FEM48_Zijuj04G0053500 [Ziziphus jujuba var. spinosa]|uniref:NTF2 domain-containing protein n=1 Tax=Ziziphus jujuba var. spinosa TaxID=714518 RepID=A0A978VI13_ZIZJJ|nr:hypothetical protein FEM48_Zijuj04G0053500 [Ziziphus jujuba var. spinosa]